MRRRGRVFQPRPGRGQPWAYKVDIAPPGAPKRDQRSKGGFRTKQAAQLALNDVLASLSHGTFSVPVLTTFGEYMSDWSAGLDRQGYKESTVAGYRRNIRNHVLTSRLAHMKLQDIEGQHLDALYDELLQSGSMRKAGGLSARTVRYVHDIISAALRDARKRKLVQRNAASDATPPGRAATKPPAIEPWTRDELRAFEAVAKGHPKYLIWHLIVVTGMRRGEACGLRWSDVDLDRSVVQVRQSLTTVDNRVVVTTPKTAEGRRTIAIDPATVEMLRSERLRQIRTFDPPPLMVFCDESGEFHHPNRVLRDFKVVLRDNGLRDTKLHGLRHTHATLLMEDGEHIKTVSERLGHASIAFTLERYVHAMATTQAQAANAFAQRLVETGSDGDEPDAP